MTSTLMIGSTNNAVATRLGRRAIVGEGNTRPDSSRRTRASLSTSIAWLLSGTRCSWPPFILAAGMAHVPPSRATSSHTAPLASPLLAAVSTRNQKHSSTDNDAGNSSTIRRASPTRTQGSGGRAPSMTSPAGLRSTRFRASAQAKIIRRRCLIPCRLRLSCPDGSQHVQDIHPVDPVDPVDPCKPQRRQGVTFHQLNPIEAVLDALPSRPIQLKSRTSRFIHRRNSGLLHLHERIPALCCCRL